MNNYILIVVILKYWLNKIYLKEVVEVYINGDFYFYDLGVFGVYCCGWDLRDFFLNGFIGVEGKVVLKLVKYFRSVFG